MFGESGCGFWYMEISIFGGVRLLRGDLVLGGNGGLGGEVTFLIGYYFNCWTTNTDSTCLNG